jgi:hypothetical protein
VDGICNDEAQGSHQDNQGKEKDGSSKFIGHEGYYPTLNGGWKLFSILIGYKDSHLNHHWKMESSSSPINS